MFSLLRQGDGGLLTAHAYLQSTARGMDGEILFAEPPDQVERGLRRLLAREPQSVRPHGRFDRGTHLGRGTEEPIGRGEPAERLVRALEVVVLQEQPDSPLTIVKVRKHRTRQPLLPQRFPEPLDLAAGLGVMRAAFDVVYALTPKLLLKPGHPAPRGVLPPLVGQYLPRRPVLRNRTRQGFEHQLASLVMRHHQAHQVAGVIVEKGRHINALVATQQEREHVRLPELVGLGPFKALQRGRQIGPGLGWLAGKSLGLQHPAHRGLRGAHP